MGGAKGALFARCPGKWIHGGRKPPQGRHQGMAHHDRIALGLSTPVAGTAVMRGGGVSLGVGGRAARGHVAWWDGMGIFLGPPNQYLPCGVVAAPLRVAGKRVARGCAFGVVTVAPPAGLVARSRVFRQSAATCSSGVGATASVGKKGRPSCCPAPERAPVVAGLPLPGGSAFLGVWRVALGLARPPRRSPTRAFRLAAPPWSWAVAALWVVGVTRLGRLVDVYTAGRASSPAGRPPIAPRREDPVQSPPCQDLSPLPTTMQYERIRHALESLPEGGG